MQFAGSSLHSIQDCSTKDCSRQQITIRHRHATNFINQYPGRHLHNLQELGHVICVNTSLRAAAICLIRLYELQSRVLSRVEKKLDSLLVTP